MFLGNRPPTPPLSQNLDLNETVSVDVGLGGGGGGLNATASLACKAGAFCSEIHDFFSGTPPSWMLKLPESWGESN